MKDLNNPRLSNLGEVRSYYEHWMRELRIPKPNPDHYNGQVFKIGKYEYPGLWLDYYAIARHLFDCMACASDYANWKTGLLLPFTSTRKWDYQLLAAHAKMKAEMGVSVVKEAQREEVCA